MQAPVSTRAGRGLAFPETGIGTPGPPVVPRQRLRNCGGRGIAASRWSRSEGGNQTGWVVCCLEARVALMVVWDRLPWRKGQVSTNMDPTILDCRTAMPIGEMVDVRPEHVERMLDEFRIVARIAVAPGSRCDLDNQVNRVK